jgi:membrane fusion protein (multidrug efflux system)
MCIPLSAKFSPRVIAEDDEEGVVMSSVMHRAQDTASTFGPGAGRLAALLLATAAPVLLSGCDSKKPAAGGFGPLPVSVVTVSSGDVALRNEWVGTLDGNVNAQIQPQVSGYLIKQDYKEGSVVQKGQVLFEIDPRPFQATLDQAKGQLGQAQGALGQAQAQQGLAEINLKRDTPLAEQRAIAQSQLDTDKQTLATAAANVASAQAQIASAKATIESAELNLGFTRVRSLISGVAGQATTQVGNLVSPQSTLTAVSQLDPIRVYFSISDGEYLGLIRASHAGNGDILKAASAVPLTLSLSDGTNYPQKGKIVFVDRQMNQQTGALRIAAIFPNPGNLLRPGQFGRVSANTQIKHNAILVPQIAVTDLQGLKQVYTVTPDNKVHVVNVQLGAEAGNNWVVLSGLQPGTRIITDNLQKLGEGAPVSPHPAAAQASAPAGSNSTQAGSAAEK